MYDKKGSLLAQISVQGNKEHKEASKVTAKYFQIDGTKDAKKEQVDVKKDNAARCKDILKQTKFEYFDREYSKGIEKGKNRKN